METKWLKKGGGLLIMADRKANFEITKIANDNENMLIAEITTTHLLFA